MKELLQGTLTAGLLSFDRGAEVAISAGEHCLGPKAAVKALKCFLKDLDELHVRLSSLLYRSQSLLNKCRFILPSYIEKLDSIYMIFLHLILARCTSLLTTPGVLCLCFCVPAALQPGDSQDVS